jgi:hypothetical protein
MKIEKQVVSFEIAKKLNKLMGERTSLFSYYGDSFIYPAYTVAELGEMLPANFPTKKDNYSKMVFFTCWDLKNPIGSEKEVWFQRENEANARGKMLIYLLENKIIQEVKSDDRH